MWWVGLVLFGAAVLVGAMAVRERDWAVIGFGIAILGFGEWVQHPLQSRFLPGDVTRPPLLGSGYLRSTNVFGLLLDGCGLALIGFGLWRVLTQ